MGRKQKNCFYGGLLSLSIGFLLFVLEIGTTFPIILMVIGGILFLGAMITSLIDGKEKTPPTTPGNDATHIVYKESLLQYMEVVHEIAEDLGKIENYNKYENRLKEKLLFLQSSFGYALQDLPNRDRVLAALCFYYFLNADGHVYIYTRQETTDEQFANIFQMIMDNMENELLDDDPDFFMKNIVDSYFMRVELPNKMKR